MAQPHLATEGAVADKIAAAKKRVSAAKALSHIASDGAVHIVLPPETVTPNPMEKKLAVCFEGIRENFKKYNTKAKHHINSYIVAPEHEQDTIDRYFGGDKELQKLMKHLDTVLSDFADNLKRFIKSVQNTDYKPVFSPENGKSDNFSITVKNAKGRDVGPFLRTVLYQDNHDGYTRMDVSVGYIGKQRQKIVTHSLSCDVNRRVGNLSERRGDKEYLKTENQAIHDEFCRYDMKELKSSLKRKYNR